MNNSVSIEEAVSLLLDAAVTVSTEQTDTLLADRRVLAEDIRAKLALPPFHRSAYDGFALRSEDTQEASPEHPIYLRVAGSIAAGFFWNHTLPEGQALRIMTGAALPDGADCVINFERVTEFGDQIILTSPLAPWQNVDRKGDELQEETPLFRDGEILSPAHIGVLSSQGIDQVHVYRHPKAAVLSTGSELVRPGNPLSPGKIYDSNLYTFRARLMREGYEVIESSHIPDDEAAIAEALKNFSASCDLIITTGGASVGDRDFAGESLASSGAELLFSQVRMKPGSCCFGAKLSNTLIVSLSGNPGAALTSYLRVALPAIRKVAGRRDLYFKEAMVPLKESFRKTCRNPRILKGHTDTVGGVQSFIWHEGQRNSMQMSFLHMNAFAELPPTDSPLEKGTPVRVFFT